MVRRLEMRVGCLYFPHFAAQVEVADGKSIIGKPIIIGGLPYERKVVHDASQEAVECGVKQNMPLREAYSLCPQGLFLTPSEQRCANMFSNILSLLASYSPAIEAETPGSVFIDLSYSCNEAQFAKQISQLIENRFHLHTSISVASNKFVAWVASEIPKLGEVITIPEGKEKNFLQDLPITFLPASPEILRRFQLLGIYRMGQLADLPLEAVNFQFGNEGKRLWELSNGMDSSRLIPWKGVSILREQIYLEPSVDNAECLLSSAAELLNKLSLRLKQRCQYCHRLTLSLFLSSGKSVVKLFHFKEATSSKEMMLPHLKRYLEGARFSAPVSEIKLTLSDFCCEEGKQDSFLDRPMREESRLSRALNWLQQRYGKTVVKKVVLKENSALPEDSFTFIDFNF